MNSYILVGGKAVVLVVCGRFTSLLQLCGLYTQKFGFGYVEGFKSTGKAGLNTFFANLFHKLGGLFNSLESAVLQVLNTHYGSYYLNKLNTNKE